MAESAPRDAKPLSRRAPLPSATTKPFWLGASERRLLLQFDEVSGRHQFFPRPVSLCSQGPLRWVEAKGTGNLVAVTCCRVAAPGFEAQAPYLLAIVRLDEGPRLLAQLVHADLNQATVGLAVRLTWDAADAGPQIYAFEPAQRLDDQRREQTWP